MTDGSTDPGPAGPLPTPDFDGAGGLLPAVVQDAATGEVRMLGYMNRSALEQTVDTGRVTFHSRSKDRLWVKGESSGNWLEAVEVRMDCDGDALLVRARPHGPTCHTGDGSCFDSALLWRTGAGPAAGPDEGREEGRGDAHAGELGQTLDRLASVVAGRDRRRPEGSYTARLLEEGPQLPARKLAEEAVELALAAVGGEGRERQAGESADLLYHLLVLWRGLDLSPDRVARVLDERMDA